MAKIWGIHVTDVTDHELSIAESNISEGQTDPLQDDDAPDTEVDPILDYIQQSMSPSRRYESCITGI